MNDHVYKKIEVVGSSATSLEDAVRNAVQRAGKTVQHLRWFEVSEIRGDIEGDQVAHWQATVKIGFRLNE